MLDGRHDFELEKKVLRRSKRANKEYVLSPENVRAVMAGVHLDQVLYDLVIRKAPYTRSTLVYGYLQDFFSYIMSQRMEMMFIPLDNTKLPEQIGKVIVTTMLQQTLVDRCRTLLTTYPCAFITEEDKRNCEATQYTPCFTRENPPPGYGFGQWEMVNSFGELLSYRRQYTPAGNEPALIISDPPSRSNRRKRSPLRKLGKRPKKKGGSSSSSKSGSSRGGSRRGPPSPSRNVLMRLGAGTGVGAGMGAAKTRPGAPGPGVFNTLSLQDIRRMNTQTRPRVGSASGTHSFTSGSGPQAANLPPVSLTNLRARTTSLDSFQPPNPIQRSPSVSSLASLPGSSGVPTRGAIAVPRPVPAPRSGWHPMPPLEPPNYFIPNYKQRPVPQQRRNLAGDRPLSRSSSTSSLDSLDSSFGDVRSASRITNEGGSFLPQVREDFKLHNRVGDAMRTFSERHPYWTKAGKYAGTGLAGLGAYITASQIDRAIQKKQDDSEEKTAEKHKNLTDTLEADLLREKLANEKFKQQSEFASQVLANAIRTGQVPTELVENYTQRPPVPAVQPSFNYGSWNEVDGGKN